MMDSYTRAVAKSCFREYKNILTEEQELKRRKKETISHLIDELTKELTLLYDNDEWFSLEYDENEWELNILCYEGISSQEIELLQDIGCKLRIVYDTDMERIRVCLT